MNRPTRLLTLGITLLLGLAGGYWLADRLPGFPGGEGGPGQSPASQSRSETEQESLPYRSGPFRFSIRIEPERPVVGENRLFIRLADEDGEPVTGASIRAVAEMPAMGAMPAMRAPADMRETGPGLYEGEFSPSMDGAWPLRMEITKEGLGQTQFSFDLATGRRGLEPGTGVAGMNAGDANNDEAPPGTITVDVRRRQLIGVTFGKAVRRELRRTIRAVGRVAYDETRLTDVSLKYDVWIGELRADYLGQPVQKGQMLFTIYSPELYSAQQEYLDILRRGRSGPLLAAARQRLKLWNLADATLDALEKRGRPFEYVPIYAPASGTLVEKNIVEGTAQQAGTTLLRIADLSRVWIEADLYEAEMARVEPGLPVEIRLPYWPGERFRGEVEFVYPYLQAQTRTGRIRLSLENPDGRLKPEMYAEAVLEIPLGERLSVPEEAVLVAGETRVVFEDLGDGRLAPRRVRTGHRTGGYVEILDGLEAGARVVTSGNFLIAAESKLRSGIEQW